jgi:hypothetical protein
MGGWFPAQLGQQAPLGVLMTNHPLSHFYYYPDYADEMIHYCQSTAHLWVIASPIDVETVSHAA